MLDNFPLEDINVDELKQLTKNAKSLKTKEETRKRDEEELKKKLELEKIQNEAQAVIQSIPFKIRQSASEGYSHSLIYQLDQNSELEKSAPYINVERKHLKLKGQLIWDFLEQKGLNPSVSVSYDGFDQYSKSYYTIHANW